MSSVAKPSKKRNPYLLSVVSEKGGVGKTTIAVNLAAQLARLGYKTILVDTDTINPSVHYYFNVHNLNYSLFDLLERKVAFKDMVVTNVIKNLDILFGSTNTSPKLISSKHVIAGFKEYAKQNQAYDFIILDTAPGYFRRDILTTFNNILLVFTPSISSCVAATRLYIVCKNKNVNCQLAGNMVTVKEAWNMVEMMHLYQKKVLTLIPKTEDVERSLTEHVPLVIMSKNSEFTSAIKRLAQKIISDSNSIHYRISNIKTPPKTT